MDKEIWQQPVIDYVNSFNSNNDLVKIKCIPATVMDFVHLDFRPAKQIEDPLADMLHVAVTYPNKYHLSGWYNVPLSGMLSQWANENRARTVAGRVFKRTFEETHDKGLASPITPNSFPHVLYRYVENSFGRKDLSKAELHFAPVDLENFADYDFESEIDHFMWATK